MFKNGYPYLPGDGGISYEWPDPSYRERFSARRKELAPELLERARHYMGEFDVGALNSSCPHVTEGERGMSFHIGTGGRLVRIADFMSGFVVFHNMDGYHEWFLGFNLASDTLEMLDESIEAPRVLAIDGGFALRYPLPDGHRVLDLKRYPQLLDREWLQRRFDIMELGAVQRTSADEDAQEITGERGRIRIADGVCVSSGFERWDACRPGFVISQLLRSFIAADG